MTQSLHHPATHTSRVRVQHSLQETQLPLFTLIYIPTQEVLLSKFPTIVVCASRDALLVAKGCPTSGQGMPY